MNERSSIQAPDVLPARTRSEKVYDVCRALYLAAEVCYRGLFRMILST